MRYKELERSKVKLHIIPDLSLPGPLQLVESLFLVVKAYQAVFSPESPSPLSFAEVLDCQSGIGW